MSQIALDALDVWSDTVRGLASDVGTQYLKNFNDSFRGYGIIAAQDSRRFAENLKAQSAITDVYAVRPDMKALIDAAATTVPYHPLLSPDEFPDQGVVYLPNDDPFTKTDSRGNTTVTRLVQWFRTTVKVTDNPADRVEGDEHLHLGFRDAVVLVMYSDKKDVRDHYSRMMATREQMDLMPRWLPWHMTLFGVQHPSDALGWAPELGDPVYSEEQWSEADIQRWMLSFWHLLREKMTAVTEPPVPRPARRRAQRALCSSEVPLVKVVDLTRPSRPSEARGGSVDWSHRWMVRPHWRRQWYPSVGEHRLKLIAAYTKGPEDRPLVVKATVFDVKAPGGGGSPATTLDV